MIKIICGWKITKMESDLLVKTNKVRVENMFIKDFDLYAGCENLIDMVHRYRRVRALAMRVYNNPDIKL